MIDEPQIVQTEVQPTAVVRFTIPRAEIAQVMGPAKAEVMAAVEAQGVGPAGPMFSRHFRMDPGIFDFEVGVPVSAPLAPAGRVVASELPAATVARAVYRGPYERLGSAWGELDAALKAAGHELAPGLWERYVAGPETGVDPADFQTELNRQLVR